MSTKRGRLLIFALASVLVACCKRTSEPPTSSGPVP